MGVDLVVFNIPYLPQMLGDSGSMPDPTVNNLMLWLTTPLIAFGLGAYAWLYPEKIFKPELTEDIKDPKQVLRVLLIALGAGLALKECWFPLKGLILLFSEDYPLQLLPFLVSLVPTVVGILVASFAGPLSDLFLRKAE